LTRPLLSCHSAPPPPYPPSLHDALPISHSNGTTSSSSVPPPRSSSMFSTSRTRTPPPRRWPPSPPSEWGWPPARSAVSSSAAWRSEEHTSELQSRFDLVCRLLLEKQNRQ